MNVQFSSILMMLLCFGLSCSKSKLTKPTQTGANTFSCKVNGNVYVAQIQGLSLSGAQPVEVQNLPSNGFTLSTIDSRTGSAYATRVLLQLSYIDHTGKYVLNQSGSFGEYSYNYTPGPLYRTDSAHVGEVNITFCDLVNRIYSGTFYFSAIDSATGQVINVSDGRFDVKE